MRKFIVLAFVSLDGVVQAPGGPKEDESGGFEYGGWTAPYGDEVMNGVLEKQMAPADLLLGRKTFDIWENHWPARADIWPGINDVTKYVVSSTKDKLTWQNSQFLKNIDDVKALKQSGDKDIKIWGSSELIQGLLKEDLIDEFWLKIYPVVLGKGKRLFGEGTIPAAFVVTESVVSPSGVILVSYKRAGDVKTGNVGD